MMYAVPDIGPEDLTPHQKRLNSLVRELDALRQRGVDRVFQWTDDTHGPLELDVLFEVVEDRYSALWAQEPRRVEALKNTLREAIASFPTTVMPGIAYKPPTYRDVVSILYWIDLPDSIRVEITHNYEGSQDHVKAAKYLRDIGVFSDETRVDRQKFQRFVLAARTAMATFLLENHTSKILESEVKKAVDDADGTEKEAPHEAVDDTANPRVIFNFNNATATNSAFGHHATVNNTINHYVERNDGQPAAE